MTTLESITSKRQIRRRNVFSRHSLDWRTSTHTRSEISAFYSTGIVRADSKLGFETHTRQRKAGLPQSMECRSLGIAPQSRNHLGGRQIEGRQTGTANKPTTSTGTLAQYSPCTAPTRWSWPTSHTGRVSRISGSPARGYSFRRRSFGLCGIVASAAMGRILESTNARIQGAI